MQAFLIHVGIERKPLADATALRLTLNTMLDPQRVAFTIAIGNSPLAQAWPHGAGVSSPAALFVTVLGLNFVGDALRDALDPRLRV